MKTTAHSNWRVKIEQTQPLPPPRSPPPTTHTHLTKGTWQHAQQPAGLKTHVCPAQEDTAPLHTAATT